MIEALFVHVEAGLKVEDRLTVLDRDDPARRERPAVADAIDFVQDRRVHVTRAQEVRVQRVHEAGRPVVGGVIDRPRCRDERLAGDLSAEHSLTLLVR